MKNENSLLAQLIKAFKILPGVGEKSAQRMAFYLLENNREGGTKLSKLLTNAMENIEIARPVETLLRTYIVIFVLTPKEIILLFAS